MTTQAVFCIRCTPQFVASIQAAYGELKKKRGINLRVIHVEKADDIRHSDLRSWQPYRIALFIGEPGTPDLKSLLEEIREVGMPHKLCLFNTYSSKRVCWITDHLEETPDPTRVRKLFAYGCKKKDRPRAIANTLVREIAQDRI